MGLPTAGVELVAEGLASFLSGMGKADDSVQAFGKSGDGAGKSFSSGFGDVVTGALRKIGELGVEALLKAGQAVAGFVKDSVSVAGDFEAGMHKFQAVAGKGVDTKGLEKFHDLFIQLGKDLPVSTSEVQQAAIEMVSGGIDPAIVAGGALKQTLQFAAASGLSLADAAATSAKFLAGWTSSAATADEKVKFLATSTDALTKAAAASSTTAAELRLGLFNVQGAAQALHASFEDVTATLALLAPAFESSAQAGTALNVFMTRLVPQTAPAAAAMSDLGLMTTSTTKLMDFMSKQGIKPLGTDLDTLGNQFTSWASSQGMTEKEITKIWGSFDQSAFFDAKGNFVGMAETAQLLKDKLGGLTDEQKISALHTLFGNDAMKVANLLMQDGAAGLEGMKKKMDEANGVQATSALMMSGYNTAMENAKGSVEALQITLGEKLLPILTDLLNKTIAPAINAFTDWSKAILSADDPLKALSDAIDRILPGFNDFGSFVEKVSAALTKGDWGKAFDVIIKGIGDLGDTIGPPLIKALDTGVQLAWSWIQQQAPGWGKALKAWGDALVAWITPMIPPALAKLGKLGAQLLVWIGEQATVLLNKLGDWAKAFIAWIPGATVTFLAEWPKMFDQFLTWVGNAAGPLLKKLGDWAVSFVAWIVPMIPGFIVALGGIALAILTFIGESALVLYKKITEVWVPALIGWVAKDVIPKIPGVFQGLYDSIESWIRTAQQSLADKMTEVGSALVSGIKQGISDAWASLTHWLEQQLEDLWKASLKKIGAGSPATEFMPVGAFAVQGIMAGIQGMLPGLSGLVDTMAMNLISQVKKMNDGIANEISNGVEKIKKQIADAQQAMADLQISGFSSEANINRQAAKNLESVAAIASASVRASVEEQLKQASDIAGTMTDPAQAAKFFKMRSDQILELAKLQEQVDQETDAQKKARLIDEMVLISNAQRAEQNAADAQRSQGSGTQDVITLIRDLLNANLSASGKGVTLPGLLENPIIAQLVSWLEQLGAAPHMAAGGPVAAGSPYLVGEHGPEYFVPRQAGMIAPPASPGQIMQGGSTSYSTTTNLSMPIYTNQSPSVLQSSLAIAGAALP